MVRKVTTAGESFKASFLFQQDTLTMETPEVTPLPDLECAFLVVQANLDICVCWQGGEGIPEMES